MLALCCAAPPARTPWIIIRREGTYLTGIKRPLSVQELETAITALPPSAWTVSGRVFVSDSCWAPPEDLPVIFANEKVVMAMLKRHGITDAGFRICG